VLRSEEAIGMVLGDAAPRAGRAGVEAGQQRCPTGISIAGWAVALVAACLLGAALSGTVGVRLGVLTAAVMVFAAVAGNGAAALAVAGLAWPLGNGFLINRLGVLTWHGRLDVWFVFALMAAVAVGMTTAQVRAQWRAWRRAGQLSTALRSALLAAASTGRVSTGPRGVQAAGLSREGL
jgi:hypothetical protein